MISEPELLESVSTRLYNACMLLNGTKTRPGALQLLSGDEDHPGLIDQAYRTGTRLEELSQTIREEVVEDINRILSFMVEGEEQDKLVESLRHRLAAMVDTETQRAVRKHIDSLDASAQEVLKATRWVGDEIQGVLVRLKDFDEALDDQFDEVRKSTESFTESVTEQQGVVQERLEQALERIDSLKEVDTTQLQIELQGAVEETARTLIKEWAKENHNGLRSVLEEHREASVAEVNRMLEGQTVFLKEGVAESQRVVAKAIKGTTYQAALDKLQEQVAETSTENARLRGELQAAQRTAAALQAKKAPGRRWGSIPVAIAAEAGRAVVIAGIVCAGVLYGVGAL